MSLLAMAIAVVIGFHFGPRLTPPAASAPLVSTVEQKVSDDTRKVGERLEPRVFPAPLLERLPPVPRSCDTGDAVELARAAVSQSFVVGRSSAERPTIVKHVPRQERGDPPKG
jgi:hypothetical protein